MGHWEGREGQDVRRGIRQQFGYLGKELPELFHHSVQLAVDLGGRQLLLGAPCFWGRFPVPKTIIPEAQEHLVTHSTRRHTHLFGGLGLRAYPNNPAALRAVRAQAK